MIRRRRRLYWQFQMCQLFRLHRRRHCRLRVPFRWHLLCHHRPHKTQINH
jgi:hypothetical protein